MVQSLEAIPPVMLPSPMTAMVRFWDPLSELATAIPRALDMEVLECPVPNASCLLSLLLGKPLIPPSMRIV